jgi:hypothetical protein
MGLGSGLDDDDDGVGVGAPRKLSELTYRLSTNGSVMIFSSDSSPGMSSILLQTKK